MAVGTGNATITYANGNTNGSIDITVQKAEIDKFAMNRISFLKGRAVNITFRDSTEIPAIYDSATDVSKAKDGSVMAYIIG